MDNILNTIKNKFGILDKESFEYITNFRRLFEYSIYLCLGVSWNNFDKLPAEKQRELRGNLYKLSLGNAVNAIRSLDSVDEHHFFTKSLDHMYAYIETRNDLFAHDYKNANVIAPKWITAYPKLYNINPFLREPCDLIVIRQYNPATENYVGFRILSPGKDELYKTWFCPKELIPYDETDFPRTYIMYKNQYYKISPFVYIDLSSLETPYTFNSLHERFTGKVFLSNLLSTPSADSKADSKLEYYFKELIEKSTQDGNLQISSNGTIMSSFAPNYKNFISMNFQCGIQDFLKNEAYVSATLWGHGGVGKTAYIQKICYDLFNSSSKKFSYIVFITAKDRIYNTRTGRIDPGTGNTYLYSDVIKSIASVIFDDARSTLTDEPLTDIELADYEKRISEFEDKLLIVIDDYETFEDSEKEKISNFLSTLKTRYHKVIITTRNRRFVIGASYSFNELNPKETKEFIQKAVQMECPELLDNIKRVLGDKDSFTHIYDATSGRPIFIYQFVYLFIQNMQKGYQEELINDIRNSPDAREFLYGRIYENLSKNAQYLFDAISILANYELHFETDSLRYILRDFVKAEQLEDSLEELKDLKVIETVSAANGKVYSQEILKIMEEQYQKRPEDFRRTVEKRQKERSELKEVSHHTGVEYDQKTVDKYRKILANPEIPDTDKQTTIKRYVSYLSETRGKSSAVDAMEEYLPLFPDDAGTYNAYTRLLWSQSAEEKETGDITQKEKAVKVFQDFFFKHSKTDPAFLSYFALGVEYMVIFDVYHRTYSQEGLRQKQYSKTFGEYGKPLFEYVKKHPEVARGPAFGSIKLALYRTAHLCDEMEKNGDKIAYGLEICDWLQDMGEKLSSDLKRVQSSLRMKQYKEGDTVEVTVKKIFPQKVLVSLDKSTVGWIPISKIAGRYIKDIYSEFDLYQSYKACIETIDPKSGRIVLSTKKFHQ